jgi:RNA polymerase sigma-70 factor, ECF subfamily
LLFSLFGFQEKVERSDRCIDCIRITENGDYNRGMDACLECIWNDYRTRLLAFVRSRVEDDEAAEDLLQEVFLRVHTRLGSLRETGRLESWLYQVARNAIIDHYRARRAAAELPETLPAEEEFFAEADSAQELAGSLREMVEALPEPYRQALLLTEFEGLSLQETADRLGISLPGAKSRVQRARQKIKDELLTCCHFEFDRYGRVVDYWESCCCCEAAAGC